MERSSAKHNHVSGRHTIKKLVETHNLSLAAIADGVGCSEQTVRHWYAGTREPQLGFRVNLARYYDAVKKHGASGAADAMQELRHRSLHFLPLREARTEVHGLTKEGSALVDLINERPIPERLNVISAVAQGIAKEHTQQPEEGVKNGQG
tara:strand:+ start:4023 stop:4472 length:450 start_codon:yes stop_codon:yes gene_type:complete